MSEIGDLIAILGEIDRAVSAEPDGDERRAQVADLVPAYREGERFGWFETFVGRNELELPTIDQAMSSLARPTRFASMLPRRLLAVALAARTFPDQFGPGGENQDASLRALSVPGIVAGLPGVETPPVDRLPAPPELSEPVRRQAQNLLELLVDPGELRTLDDWPAFVTRNDGLISVQLARLPAPCTSTVIELPQGGDVAAVAVLQTTLCVRDVDFATLATRLLDPANWPQCSPWWCSMHGVPVADPALMRFLEVVALDCPLHTLEVAVFLDFARPVDTPTRKVLTYKLSPPPAQQGMVNGLTANGAVDVDEGTIEVRDEAGHVHVETTKRVRFTGYLDTGTIAILACWIGYGDNATDLICDCSGGQPQAVDCDDVAAAASGAGSTDTPLTDAVSQLADLAETCGADAGDQARIVAERLDRDAYTPDTAAQDATRTAALAIHGWARAATAFVDAARTVARPPTKSSSPPSPSFAFRSPLAEDCDVRLAGPLKSPYDDRLDEARVEVLPPRLGRGESEFGLAVADPANLAGSTFTGKANAIGRQSGVVADDIDVYVIVP
jgi:hypothetical protein